MDDDTFDPKKWVSPAKTPPDNDFFASHRDANRRNEGAAAFWREAVAVPQSPSANAAPASTNSAGASPALAVSRRRLLAYGASGAIVGGTALAAWLGRSAPAAAPQVLADPAAQGPAAQERALNLSGPGQLASALVEAGVRPGEANAAAAAAAPHLAASGELHAIIVLLPGQGGAMLQQLRAIYINGSGVTLSRNADGTFSATPLAADVTRKIEVLRGEIDSESFYTSAVSAGLIDTLIPEFINAFSYDFNLAAEVSPGDVFEVAYDQGVNGRGEGVGQPQLLYAQLITPQKSLALYRFMAPGEEAGWFDGNGATTKRGLMRTPVDGARITSKFGMRFHPVLHYNKLHGGTDFAAPIGTPIYAAADGVIEFAAMKGANGNLTILRHDNGWETFYLHQNQFAPGIAAGVRVTQGQHIGDIGTTGRSTGPHLHYEVHIDGERVDPLSIPADDASRKRLDGPVLQAFLKERDRIDMERSKQAA